MKVLRFLGKAIFDSLKSLLYKWLVLLIRLIKLIIAIVKRICVRRKLSHWDKDATNEGCGVIKHPSFHRPDPLIYSQKYLLSLGLGVTWDNPDIVLLLNGVIVSEGDLLPNTEYEVRATIWNNSFDAPVVGLTVDFSFMSFGAGTVTTHLGTTAVNLGVKGGTNHPAFASMKWITPPSAGHYCLLVELKWIDDVNPNNNLGQNNVNVVAAHSPAKFTFQLRNDTDRPRRYTFQVDTYTLPDQKACPDKIRRRSNTQKWKEIQAAHNRSNFGVPPDWTVAINPPLVSLNPNDDVEIEVEITPPASFTGQKAFNVHALMDNGVFAGGVTVYVTKS